MKQLDLPYYDPEEHAFPVDRLNAVLERVRNDDRTQALVVAQNVNPVVRLRYNDHGTKHVETVTTRAIELFDLLKAGDVSFNGAADHGLDEADEPVIVALGAILHDVGHVVHRDRHTYYSIPLAMDRLETLLEGVYDPAEAMIVTGEVLHAILCHHTEESPLTREAGVVRIADALDMERGRSRVPYERGGRGINTISSRAIQTVNLRAGPDGPVQIEIEMTSAAGIYQVDELLKSKVEDSRLAELIDIVAVMVDEEERLIDRIEL
ncbi:MAG: HD domain-containing protein [Halobacteriota archaeon]